MLRRYRALASVPGGLAFSLAGLVARMPLSMTGVGIVLLLASTGRSYALAGVVSATYGLAGAAFSPWTSGLADRHGQQRVLPPTVLLSCAGLVGLVLAGLHHAPAATLAAMAVVTGAATPSIGSFTRARWSHLLGGESLLTTALSWESVADEVVFVVGPVLVTTLSAAVGRGAGLLAATGLALAGGAALTLQPGTEPPRHPRAHRQGGALLRDPALVGFCLVYVFMGAIFGSIEVLAVVFATSVHSAGSAGVILSAFALGSMLSGLVYGGISWRAAPVRRFVVGLAMLLVGVTPVAVVTTTTSLAAVVLVAGIGISPTIVAGFAVLDTMLAPSRRTEGFAWVTTGISLGAALASSAAGVLADRVGPHRALALPVACAVATALAAVAVLPALRRRAAAAPVRPVAGLTDAGLRE